MRRSSGLLLERLIEPNKDVTMDAALLLLYLVAAGVNYGWQPAKAAEGGYEYIVQVDPELLDAMRRGETTPIESNVPPEIAPLRKIRVVVGRSELPREMVGAVSRTAYFAGQDALAGDRYGPMAQAPVTSNDRYPAPSLPSGSRVGPPPSVADRTQAAITETGNTIRDGVEEGFRAASEEFSRGGDEIVEATRDAGQELGQQLQAWTSDPARELQATGNDVRNATERTLNNVGSHLQQVTNPFVTNAAPPTTKPAARGGVEPPPWDDNSTTAPAWADQSADADFNSMGAPAEPRRIAAAGPAWTSIGNSVAAPPLVVPRMDTIPRRTDARPFQSAQIVDEGPQFPAESPTQRETIHSPLTDPTQQASDSPTNADWSTGWNNGPSTPQVSINRAGNTTAIADGRNNTDLVQVQQPAGAPQNAEQPGRRFEDLWDDKSVWGQMAQSGPPANQAPNATSTAPTNEPQQPTVSNPDVANANRAQSPTIPQAATEPATTVKRDEPPWLPLLVVSLSLMGSLSANLFLGWSYVDARHKYRALVRKTADKFRRAAA
jgi:hypothetical protein